LAAKALKESDRMRLSTLFRLAVLGGVAFLVRAIVHENEDRPPVRRLPSPDPSDVAAGRRRRGQKTRAA
jgi:hypothetical protein